MLTWVAVGVAGWLLGNVAFVVAMVRWRDRARRSHGTTRQAGGDGEAGGDRGREDGPPPAWPTASPGGAPAAGLRAGGRAW